MSKYAILKDGKVIPVNDIAEWGKHFETVDRKIGNDVIDGKRISTVFLGIDHSFGHGPELWFETMIFNDGEWDGEYCERYTTLEEARIGHLRAVESVKKKCTCSPPEHIPTCPRHGFGFEKKA